jgi:hypothetical protein
MPYPRYSISIAAIDLVSAVLILGQVAAPIK